MLTVTVTVTGLKETNESLDKIKSVLNNLQPELSDVGKYLIGFFKDDVFESEGGIFGASWSPLTAAYFAKKSALYPGRGVLEATGKLRRGYQLYTTSTYALIQNVMPYAKYHQYGTTKMPARTLVKVDDTRITKIASIIKDGILNRIKDAI